TKVQKGYLIVYLNNVTISNVFFRVIAFGVDYF
ncbi:MAG: hypothetical protein RL365_1014, partial [Bacteroidota bacterium]